MISTPLSVSFLPLYHRARRFSTVCHAKHLPKISPCAFSPSVLRERYGIEDFEELDGYDIFELVGKKRGLLSKGGEVNFDRCSTMLLDEFRRGVMGRITLE
jgi:ribosome biogenesis GTPase A